MVSFAEKIRAIKEECLGPEQKKRYRNGWRKTGELTGEELAELLGVSSKSTIHNYLTGKTVARDREILRKVEELWEKVKQRRMERALAWRSLQRK